MAESVFSKNFDMEAYVQKRMLEISDLEERRLYKEVAEHMMLELDRRSQDMMRRLEERVFDELEQAQSDFFLTLGLTDQKHYDATDSFLHPVFPEDVSPQEVPVQEMLKALAAGMDYPLYTIYLKASYPTVQLFAVPGRRYYGTVKTPKGEYPAAFRVDKSTDYQKKLMDLYQSFICNDVSWNTVCTAYFHKLFEVSICSLESITPIEEISEVVVDFEEFSEAVNYHMVPLWNLELIEEKSSTYPVPCEDKINYEHRIYDHRLQEECSYLVIGNSTEVTHVSRVQGDLIITAPETIPHEWQLYKFGKSLKEGKYTYPLLSNRKKKSFGDDLARMFHKQMRTKAGIAAIVNGFPFENYLIYKGIEICEQSGRELTYDMDDFLTSEISIANRQKKLCLLFQAKDAENYLNYDIMSFLVTQVQASIPDYYCIGKLV